jgi:phosphatidylglycerol:prolipoprotein diacylglycerol transferase
MTLAAMLHTFDPFLVRLGPDFGLRWYGLSYVAAFVIGWWLWTRLAARGAALTPAHRVADAMLWVIAGTIVGGRLGYAIVYDPGLFTGVSSAFPYWSLLALNKGGMASHGGMVGLVLAAWWVSRGFREIDPATREVERVGRCPWLHVMDVLALIAPPGLLLGRVANFINGELLGKIVSPPGVAGPWWSVQFPQELRGWYGPGQRDALSHTPELSGEQQQRLVELVEKVRLPRDSFAMGVERLIESAGKHAADLPAVLSSRHPSQLYQAAAEGLVLGVVLWWIARKDRKPGVVAAWFFIVYGVLRVATEFWRLPDPQFGAAMRIAGLSRGQWLSVGMVAVGAVLLALALRRAGPMVRGWRSAA